MPTIHRHNLVLLTLLFVDVVCVFIFTVIWSHISVSALIPVYPIPADAEAISTEQDEALWIHADPSTHHFVDSLGRTRIFHGVNVVFKQPPFVPDTETWDPDLSFTARDAKDLREWGFNLVRLGVLWSGTYPAGPAHPDTAYMDAVSRVVSLCAAEGIYVVIDMHSDILSRRFCGNGIPDWVVDHALEAMGQASPRGDFPLPLESSPSLFPAPVDKSRRGWHAKSSAIAANATTALQVASANRDLYPDIKTCLSQDFFNYYSSNSTSLTFQALYTNAGGTRKAFEQHWQLVAGALREDPHVLMYEIINEPWPGDIYAERFWAPGQWWLDTKYAEGKLLKDFYLPIISAIQSVDDKHMIAYEPVVSNLGFTSFGGPLGGEEHANREVLSWHLYCTFAPDKVPWLILSLFCEFFDSARFAVMGQNIRKQGGGALLSEYGSLGNTSLELAELKRVGKLADSNLASRVYWQFKTYKDITSSGGYGDITFYSNGDLQQNKLRALATPYAQIIAGSPKFMRFDEQSGVLSFEYIPSNASSEETSSLQKRTTLLYLGSQLHYLDTFRVVVSSAKEEVSLRLLEGSYLEVTHTQSLAGHNLVLCVIPCIEGVDCEADPTPFMLWPEWHMCGIRVEDYWWLISLLFTGLLSLQLAFVNWLWQRWHILEGQAMHPSRQQEPYRPGCLHKLFHRLTSGIFTIALLVCLDLPVRTELWRWLVTFLVMISTTAVVSLSSGFTRVKSVALVFFLAVARTSGWMLDALVDDVVLYIALVLLISLSLSVLLFMRLAKWLRQGRVTDIRGRLLMIGTSLSLDASVLESRVMTTRSFDLQMVSLLEDQYD